MPAYVHINLRITDPEKQANVAPRFLAALETAGGRVLHFGPVVEFWEGEFPPLPLAGIFEFPTLAQAKAFYSSPAYAPIKAERLLSQEARMFVVDAEK